MFREGEDLADDNFESNDNLQRIFVRGGVDLYNVSESERMQAIKAHNNGSDGKLMEKKYVFYCCNILKRLLLECSQF